MTGVYTVFIILAVIFVPTIVYFIYVVVKDPATPDILVAMWEEFKVRSVGYLGRRTESSSSSARNKRRRERKSAALRE